MRTGQDLGLGPRRSHARERRQSLRLAPALSLSPIFANAKYNGLPRPPQSSHPAAASEAPKPCVVTCGGCFAEATQNQGHIPRQRRLAWPHELIQEPRGCVVHQVLPRCGLPTPRHRSGAHPDHRIALQSAHQHVLKGIGRGHMPGASSDPHDLDDLPGACSDLWWKTRPQIAGVLGVQLFVSVLLRRVPCAKGPSCSFCLVVPVLATFNTPPRMHPNHPRKQDGISLCAGGPVI